MLRIILMSLGAIVVVLGIVIALQPAAFSIERSTVIQAPARAIYPHIVSLRAMNAWSPFAQGDPQMKLAYSGPPSGVGSASAWDSKQMGAGSSVITAAKPDREIELRLDFLRPLKATHRALFTLEPQGDATRVTWRMEGENGFLGKAFGLVVNVDKMMGGEFDKGLASLKTLAEAEAGAASAARR